MATSGTVYSSYAKDSRLYVTWKDAGQSVSGNYTTVKWSAGISVSDGNLWYTKAVKIYSVYINGTKVSDGGTYSNITSNGKHKKLSGSIKVPHNSDGTKKFKVKISGWFFDYGDKSGDKTFTLTTIPRASTMSCPANFTAGTAGAITLTRKSTSFTHTASCSLGSGLSATTGITTSFTYTPPISLFDSATYANTTKQTGTITVQTKSGSTNIGSPLVGNITVNLPQNSSTKPTCQITGAFEEYGTSYLEKYGVLIAGKSQLTASCTSSGKLKASIASHHASIKGGTAKVSNNIITISSLASTATNSVLSYYVKDGRGFSSDTATLANPYTVVDYKMPNIVSFNALRINETTGKEDPVNGTKIKFKLDYYCDPIAISETTPSGNPTILNTAYITIWKLEQDENGNLSNRESILSAPASEIIDSDGYTAIIGGDYPTTSSYIFEATIVDDLTTSHAVMGAGARSYVKTAKALMSFYKSDGITFGEIADKDGFRVSMDAYFSADIYLDDSDVIDFWNSLVNNT